MALLIPGHDGAGARPDSRVLGGVISGGISGIPCPGPFWGNGDGERKKGNKKDMMQKMKWKPRKNGQSHNVI